MKKLTRILCLLLGLLTLLGAFAACGGDEDPTTAAKATTAKPSGDKTVTTTGQVTTNGTVSETSTLGTLVQKNDPFYDPRKSSWEYEETEEGDLFVVDPLDYDAIDYSGEDGAREFRLLVCEAWAQWTFPREDGGQADQVKSTAYLRNLDIEDLLGIDLEADYVEGHGGYEAVWTNKLTDAMRNDCALLCGYSYWMAKHGQQELLENLFRYQYPDINNPWYPYQIDEWSQYDCLFYVTGTCTTRTTAEGNTVFYEQEMLQDNMLADPTQIAIKGEWTLSKLYEYTSAFHNIAVATKDTQSPIFGIIATTPDSFYYGMGNRYTTLDKRGKQTLSCLDKSNVETATACVEELLAVLDTDEGRTSYNGEAARALLQNKRAAFVVGGLINITWISGDTKYAALPMPKRNLNQSVYYTITTGAIEVFGIPTSTPDGEMSAVVLEAVYSSDYRDMAPIFFEKNLKGKYTNSTEAAAIFDLIRYSRVIDFGWINAFGDKHIGNVFGSCFTDGAMSNGYATQVNSPDFQEKLNDGLMLTLSVYKKHGLK